MDQFVTVMVKANVVETVTNRDGKQLSKQDCIVGDSFGNCRVVLWEQDVGKMMETQSYKLACVRLKSFAGANYLYLTSESEITHVDDICKTAEMIDDLMEHGIVKNEVESETDVATYSDQHKSCVKCNCK